MKASITNIRIEYTIPGTNYSQLPALTSHQPQTCSALTHGSKTQAQSPQAEECSTHVSGMHFVYIVRSHLPSQRRSRCRRAAKLRHGNRASSSLGTHAYFPNQETAR